MMKLYLARGSYEAGCAWGRAGSIQGRQECVAPWTGGCSVFTYMYVGDTGPFTGRGCCQVAPPHLLPPGGRRLHLLLLRARRGAGRLQRDPGAKVPAGSIHSPTMSSCDTDNCNTKPTAFGPEPTSSSTSPPREEEKQEEGAAGEGDEGAGTGEDQGEAGRLAESRPAELDIAPKSAADKLFLPHTLSLLAILVPVINELSCFAV